MCGIGGMFDPRAASTLPRARLEAINRVQHHRGPDEAGVWLGPGVGFAHTRLSIIDLAEGQQPMSTADGTITIAFNGEIYNFRSLREELERRGHGFRTHSDTEVILEAYRAFGDACVPKLRGMFAFAIWDASRQHLLLARDRVGIKPLFYGFTKAGMLVFGSELKALLVHEDLPRVLDKRAVEDYFTFGYVPEPRTIFEHAAKLPPGFTLTLNRGDREPVIRQYWDVPTDREQLIDEASARTQLIERLGDAVDSHLMSEVPLGAFLSGGVDSSSVVAMMARGGETVTTCSIAFKEKSYNETEFARQVAARYHTNHHEDLVDTDDFGLVDALGGLYDEPYADSSAIPTYRVCELARRHVTVALSGDGGDELFAGYRRYRWHMHEERWRSRVPGFIRKPVFGTLGRVYPKLDWAPRFLRAKTTFQALARDSVDAYRHSVAILRDAERAQLFSAGLKRDLAGYSSAEVFARHAANFRGVDPLKLIQYLDFKTYLVGDILTKVDRASMAHALEVRVPILDHELIEWAMPLPSSLKLTAGEGKHLLKQAMEPHLPHDVLYRTKMGFGVPLSEWFRGPLRQRVRDGVLSQAMRDSGLFDMGYITSLVEQHQSGQREFSAPLWSLLMFDSFLRRSLA